MKTDIKHLGKTALQIEREQMKGATLSHCKSCGGMGCESCGFGQGFEPLTQHEAVGKLGTFDMATVEESGTLADGWPYNVPQMGDTLADYFPVEQSPLSADECAIALNDPNGCASWLRELADAIERGEHVGITHIEASLCIDGRYILVEK